ncbi:MAG: hypothetical protein JTJ30_04860 [Catenibacterium mitsuokai]|nr:MazG nucleotide pyrophosphohydrolase domain-containing protein [Catenibacterium mitsuokai]MBN2931307.1 hypothetical protein [Catenibacterium mitsuokai]
MGEFTELIRAIWGMRSDLGIIACSNGDDLTLTIASEECAELIQAITKVKRYGLIDKYHDNLQEEVADVLICISELLILGYLDLEKINEYQINKIDREWLRVRKKRRRTKTGDSKVWRNIVLKRFKKLWRKRKLNIRI